MAKQATNKLKFIDTVVTRYTRTSKGGSAKLQTPLTISVATQLGWISEDSSENEIGILWPWQSSCECEGEFRPNSFTLTPKDSTQRHQAMDLSGAKIYRLVIVRREIKAKKGKGKVLWLNFTVDFTDDHGGKKLEAYMQTVDVSTLQFSYEQQAILIEAASEETHEEDESDD